MNDMTKGASAKQLPDMQANTDVQAQEPLKPEDIPNKFLISPTGISGARVNPIIPEERARIIREMKEDPTSVPDIKARAM